MRVLLFTGKGGVGKTTTAAATAALAAAAGRKTLIVSTDPAHSLADALGVQLGADVVELDGGLHALQIDAQRAFVRAWRVVQRYLMTLLDAGGVDPVDAEELTVLPGAEEVLALLAVRDEVRSGRYDLVTVDCAATAETLRLLRLPEVLSWWLDRVLPVERRAVRSLRPLLGRLSSVPVPDATVFEAVGRLQAELADVRALLVDPDVSSVRLVLTPEAVVVAEARRTLTALSLHGYRVDGIVANRVFPAGGEGWQQGWVTQQRHQLAEIDASFGALPVWQAPYGLAEPIGLEALVALGRATYGDHDPTERGVGREPLSVQRTVDGFTLSIALPFAVRGDTTLTRHDDEITVTVGSQRRVLTLPSALRRCSIDGARLVDAGERAALVVRFVLDPDLWSHA